MMDADRAATLDILTGVTPQTVTDYPMMTIMEPMMLSMPIQYTKTTSVTLTARTQFNSSFTSTFAVGAPYQGNMRQLAFDRWNYMYPS